MAKNKLHWMIWLFAAYLIMGCEDLEETYKEYAGDGMIRYVGKCTDVEVVPGWERLKVVWKNSLDATVKKVKITWQAETDAQPSVRYVEREEPSNGMDSVYLEELQNAFYTVRVSNISSTGAESIVEEKYGRPYTSEHENLRSFTRGLVNFYPLGDKMVVVLDGYNEDLKDLVLCYTDTEGTSREWNIKEHMTDSLIMESYNFGQEYMQILPDPDEDGGTGIDFTKPVVLKRSGKLSDCFDEITFKDETLLLDERVWSTDFVQLMIRDYGQDWESRISEIETIELDYDLNTFQDLFYLPNLKKVVLGKNRYMVKGQTKNNRSVTDDYRSLMTLQFLKDVRGIKTESYNGHYFLGTCDMDGYHESWKNVLSWYVERIDDNLISSKSGNLNLMPSITPLDATGWEVTCSDTIYSGDKEKGAAFLLDGDATTYFEPGQTLGATVFEVKIDMLKEQVIHGFKVVQPAVETATDLRYLLSSVKIEVSEDGYMWRNATYVEGGCTIGNSLEETTFIPVPEALQKPVRYIRLSMANKHTSTLSSGNPMFSLRLGDFIPY